MKDILAASRRKIIVEAVSPAMKTAAKQLPDSRLHIVVDGVADAKLEKFSAELNCLIKRYDAEHYFSSAHLAAEERVHETETAEILRLERALIAEDWAALSDLIGLNFAYISFDVFEKLSDQITNIDEKVKNQYPNIAFLTTIAEQPRLRFGSARVQADLQKIATKSLVSLSLEASARGTVAQGMRLMAARLSGLAETKAAMLEELQKSFSTLLREDISQYRTSLVIVCGQAAITQLHSGVYGEAEAWCRQGLNLVSDRQAGNAYRLLALLATISAVKGDMLMARDLVYECEQRYGQKVQMADFLRIPYLLSNAMVLVEQQLWGEAEEAYDRVAKYNHHTEYWPYIVWIGAHVIEEKLGGAEALTWLRRQISEHKQSSVLWPGLERILTDLTARLAWRNKRHHFFKELEDQQGLVPVYQSIIDGDFAQTAVRAVKVAEGASKSNDLRMQSRALMLKVVADTELDQDFKSESRSAAIKLIEQHGLSTPKLERPPWWDEVADISPKAKKVTRRATGVLTPAEIRTLNAVAEHGTTNRAAAVMHLSVYTVRDHMKAIHKKLGVTSRNEAIRVASEAGLLQN